MPRANTIALLTDFGLSDSYVASMKAVISTIAPDCRIVDISHDVAPQQIADAAYLIWSCYKYFPPNTVFVCVVDPGVGTNRNIVCVEIGGYRFLAPDNGLLKYILGSSRFRAFDVTNRKFFLEAVSSTFHGRDIFASVAAHLAIGRKPEELGPRTRLITAPSNFVTISKSGDYNGAIVHIDRFGNVITNFLPVRSPRKSPILTIGKRCIRAYYPTYADAPPGVPFLIRGSTGLLEISIREANAAVKLRARLSQPLKLKMK